MNDKEILKNTVGNILDMYVEKAIQIDYRGSSSSAMGALNAELELKVSSFGNSERTMMVVEAMEEYFDKKYPGSSKRVVHCISALEISRGVYCKLADAEAKLRRASNVFDDICGSGDCRNPVDLIIKIASFV